MNIQELFTTTNTALNEIILQLRSGQLALEMPDYAFYGQEKHTLRDYLQICAHENACVSAMLKGEANLPSNQENIKDYLEDDFKTNLTRLTETANEAVLNCSEDDLDRTVHMSYMDAPARAYLSDIIIQRSSSAIDIAKVADITFIWPEDLVQGIWDIATPNATVLREYGVFPPEVSVAEDASLQDKLVALMGRQP